MFKNACTNSSGIGAGFPSPANGYHDGSFTTAMTSVLSTLVMGAKQLPVGISVASASLYLGRTA